MTKQEFIDNISKYVIIYAPKYGIKVASVIISQAILESGWGNTKLAASYHNYFGMKTGSKWTGASVNLKTKEEYTPGVKTTIKDNFRVYRTLEDGIKGYFDFISLPRYRKLKNVFTPEEYLQILKEAGYATDSKYIKLNLDIINQYELRKYDKTLQTPPSIENHNQEWSKVGDKWTYYDEDGNIVKDSWKKINGLWYVFDGDGYTITGWFKSGDDWYYMDNKNCHMLSSQWLELPSGTYYLKEDGKMATHAYIQSVIDNDLYYFVDFNGQWKKEYNTNTPDLSVFPLVK